MRAIDADAIVVHKFPSEDYDPSENDAEKAYRKGWNDALDAVAEFQPSAQPEIIRCKDCQHYNAGFECLIEGYGIERNGEWYCGDAERRIDE